MSTEFKKRLGHELWALALLGMVSSSSFADTQHTIRFNDVVTFGDSVSDGGFRQYHSRFIVGGKDVSFYNEILSLRHADRAHVPYTEGGNNYAESGSRTDTTVLKVSDRISDYLEKNNGVADPNNLYLLWTGANDIADIIESIPTLLQSFLNANPYVPVTENYIKAADKIGELAQELVDAGARYVVVPNIPKAGNSPFTSNALPMVVDIFSLGLIGPILGVNGALSNLFDLNLRKVGYVNNLEERQRVLVEVLNESVVAPFLNHPVIGFFAKMKGITLETTSPMVNHVYGLIYAIENNMTDMFNQLSEDALDRVEGNLVRIHTDKLFTEMLDSPRSFGISNVLVSSCMLGTPAWACDATQPFYDPSLIMDSIFSDWFHPSPAAHLVIADYITAVLEAPTYVVQLNFVMDRFLRDKNSHLDDQFISLRNTAIDDKHYALFGGYSGAYEKLKRENYKGSHLSNDLAIGLSSRVHPNFSLGGLVTLTSGEYNSRQTFNYGYAGVIASLFAQYTHENGFWSNLDLHYGRVNFDNINRRIKLGAGTRIESGKTDIDTYGARAQLGFSFNISSDINLGPFIGYEWYKSKFYGYSEKGDMSTAMTFSGDSSEFNIGKIGIILNGSNIKYQPYFMVAYSRNFDKTDEKVVVAGLKNAASTFVRYIDNSLDAKSWIEAKVGMSYLLNSDLKLYSSVGYRHEDTNSKRINYSVGLSYAF